MTDGTLEISIRPRFQPFLFVARIVALLLIPPVVFLFLWIAFGDWGGNGAFDWIVTRILLPLLALGGAWAELLLGWSLLLTVGGRERLSMDATTLRYEQRVFGVPIRREFALERISNIAIYNRYGQKHPLPGTTVYSAPLFDTGVVIFDYDGKPTRLGIGLRQADGQAIVEHLTRRHVAKP